VHGRPFDLIFNATRRIGEGIAEELVGAFYLSIRGVGGFYHFGKKKG
jgi:hypothetical protein